ncbi:unnamed protein product, partial [Tetraodon nigroviridis]
EENCTYFRHFTPGQDAEIFEYKTQKEYNISAAAISIFSLIFSILGSLCLLGSYTGKGKCRAYLLKPAGMFFAFAGPLRLHLPGGDAPVRQAHDRERGHRLDPILLLLVLRLRLQRLRPPLPHRYRPADPLHASDAQEPVGDVHGRRAGA